MDRTKSSTQRSEPSDGAAPIGRRRALKILGAGVALANAAACRPTEHERALPYTATAPEVTPGKPLHFATSMVLDGYATGLVVESHTGRPTKVEGNPDHPASLGASGAYEQAAAHNLYDPDRARAMRRRGGGATIGALVDVFGQDRGDRGERLRFLLGPTSSPSHAALIDRIRERFPLARLTFWAPLATDNAVQGAGMCFGQLLQPVYDVGAASVILALDADFLDAMPFRLRHARRFAARRRIDSPDGTMNRLYAVEPMLTVTGTMADHRLARRPSEIVVTAASIASALARTTTGGPAKDRLAALPSADRDPRIEAIARDLAQAGREALVIVGDRQPAEVHALGHAMNAMLGGDRVRTLIDPVLLSLGDAEIDLAQLVEQMRAGAVDTLVMVDNNPVYATPAALGFAEALEHVRDTLYVGLYDDETSARSSWFVPQAHWLESWGDARAYDGTLSTQQPLIDPLFGGLTTAEVLAVFAGERAPDARRLMRAVWEAASQGSAFEELWNASIQLGLLPDSAAPPRRPDVDDDALGAVVERIRAFSPAAPDVLELDVRQDSSVYDGRFANDAWLQELPRPVTKLTWDNAAIIGTATASRLGVATEDVVTLTTASGSVKAPVLIVPGIADGAVVVHSGYGRSGAEGVARGVGFSAYRLLPPAPVAFAPVGVARLAGERHSLARTQRHWSTEDRPIALTSTLAAFRENPEFTAPYRGPLPSLLPPWDLEGDQWAMTIDLSICTGCSACVMACQAENNILVVGKEEVLRDREMHWLRIDTYVSGPPEAPRVVHEPMLCQHCEKAPCEYVCPVNATVHSPDGLNEMVYNRCVGTRFCSNNCPYKVRRFNWFDWQERVEPNQGPVSLQRNPQVTVRERGVMEKCTYCVQRIRKAGIEARIGNRPISPGEVVTACAQACPTEAIQFGSLQHRDTRMVRWREQQRAFAVLHELGTRPRTIYLARIDNPNPEIG